MQLSMDVFVTPTETPNQTLQGTAKLGFVRR
jgi:hypothetical protein